jgi:hypothetical protein
MPRVPPWDTDDLLREELFSVERLEQHAASLAAAQKVTEQNIPAGAPHCARACGTTRRHCSRITERSHWPCGTGAA